MMLGMTVTGQQQLDADNANFWSELCGSHLAREVGVTDASAQSLARFDRAYMDLYPYLERYLPWRSGERVLEIGLGYGTVGEFLARRGLDYHGLDISPGPVAMMTHRLKNAGVPDAEARATTGSALAIPYPDASLDVLVSIGCLHHTGDLASAIAEVHRVLRPGGEAMVMVYNRHSYRRAVMLPVQTVLRGGWRDRGKRDELVRAAYDANAKGDAAPATEFTSVADVRRMFSAFSDLRVRRENFDAFVLHLAGRTAVIPRKLFLNNVARLVGSDLYVTARK
jgi:ubiquinone/menaquinone biosynthesis C-methylase UbiE